MTLDKVLESLKDKPKPVAAPRTARTGKSVVASGAGSTTTVVTSSTPPAALPPAAEGVTEKLPKANVTDEAPTPPGHPPSTPTNPTQDATPTPPRRTTTLTTQIEAAPSHEDHVTTLQAMGFTDRGAVVEALRRVNGDLEGAVEVLLSGVLDGDVGEGGKGETVSFEKVLETLKDAPKPVAAPRSARSLKRGDEGGSADAIQLTPEKKETVTFDQVLETLKDAPKPVAAPRSARSLKRDVPEKSVEATTSLTDEKKETVSFDQVLETLKDLPKPVAAPRSARSLRKSPEEVTASDPPKTNDLDEPSKDLPTHTESPKSSTSVNKAPPSLETPLSSTAPDHAKSEESTYTIELTMLTDMGFTDTSVSLRALTGSKGNVEAAIEMLISGTVPSGVVASEGIQGVDEEKKETVAFDEGLKTVNELPNPLAVQPSVRSSEKGGDVAAVEGVLESNTSRLSTTTVSDKKETVSFDQVLETLKDLPKPTPAPRSSRSLKKDTAEKPVEVIRSTASVESTTPPSTTPVSDGLEKKETVSFDQVLETLKDLPKPTPAPRSARSLKKDVPEKPENGTSPTVSSETTPQSTTPVSEALEKKETVSFDKVLETLKELPKPTPAPRSSRSLKKDSPEKPVEAVMVSSETTPQSTNPVNEATENQEAIPVDVGEEPVKDISSPTEPSTEVPQKPASPITVSTPRSSSLANEPAEKKKTLFDQVKKALKVGLPKTTAASTLAKKELEEKNIEVASSTAVASTEVLLKPRGVASSIAVSNPRSSSLADETAEKKEEVPQTLQASPSAVPGSTHTLNKEESEKSMDTVSSIPVSASTSPQSDAVERKETVSFDKVMETLKDLPKPTAAPRSARTLKRDVADKPVEVVSSTNPSMADAPVKADEASSANVLPSVTESTTPQALPSKETVSFDQVLETLKDLPKPSPAPRLARSLKKAAAEEGVDVVPSTAEPAPLALTSPVMEPLEKKETVSFDQVIETLKDLPKPTAAPRSAKSLKKVPQEEKASDHASVLTAVELAETSSPIPSTEVSARAEPERPQVSKVIPSPNGFVESPMQMEVDTAVKLDSVSQKLMYLKPPIPENNVVESKPTIPELSAVTVAESPVPALIFEPVKEVELPQADVTPTPLDMVEKVDILEKKPEVVVLPAVSDSASLAAVKLVERTETVSFDQVLETLKELPKPTPAPRSTRTVKKDVPEDKITAKSPIVTSATTVMLPADAPVERKDTVSFDQVLETLKELPKPTPAPRSSRTVKKDVSEDKLMESGSSTPISIAQSALPVSEAALRPVESTSVEAVAVSVAIQAESKESVSLGPVVETLKDLPKPTPAPRSSKTVKKDLQEDKPVDVISAAPIILSTTSVRELEAVPAVDSAVERKETVSFDQVLETLKELPKPTAAPRSSRTVKEKAPEEKSIGFAEAVRVPVGEPAERKETVSFDQVLETLKELPKPTPAPRSSRTVRKDIQDDKPAEGSSAAVATLVSQSTITPSETPVELVMEKKETVSFDQVLETLKDLPKPTPAPRSARTVKKDVLVEKPAEVISEAPDGPMANQSMEQKESIAFDQVLETLKDLPKPTPAPRSSKTMKKDVAENRPSEASSGVSEPVAVAESVPGSEPLERKEKVSLNQVPETMSELPTPSAPSRSVRRLEKAEDRREGTVSLDTAAFPSTTHPINEPVERKETVSFDTALEILNGLPKPVAAPRSAKSLKKSVPEENSSNVIPGRVVTSVLQPTTPPSAAPIGEPVEKREMGPMDKILEMSNEHPKPVAAPRSARSLTKSRPEENSSSAASHSASDASQATVPSSVSPIAKKETISFDKVLETLSDLPKPVAAPRSARTLKKEISEAEPIESVTTPGVGSSGASSAVTSIEVSLEKKETVSFDQVLETLKDLPKPTAAPRSARTLKRETGNESSESSTTQEAASAPLNPTVSSTANSVAPTGPVPAPRSSRTVKSVAPESNGEPNTSTPSSPVPAPRGASTMKRMNGAGAADTPASPPVAPPRSARTLKRADGESN
ncbi:hypothetical protein HDU67_006789 [Dinochytrium kinnereticum]|nr:hypothetical protein HDU67_006789 [Dinochytrium kinnereticum]